MSQVTGSIPNFDPEARDDGSALWIDDTFSQATLEEGNGVVPPQGASV
jgi:hypothetical protein